MGINTQASSYTFNSNNIAYNNTYSNTIQKFNEYEQHLLAVNAEHFFENLQDITIIKKFEAKCDFKNFDEVIETLNECFEYYYYFLSSFIKLIPNYKTHVMKISDKLDGAQKCMVGGLVEDFLQVYFIAYDIANMKINNKYICSTKLWLDNVNKQLDNFKLVFFERVYDAFKDCMIFSNSCSFSHADLKQMLREKLSSVNLQHSFN